MIDTTNLPGGALDDPLCDGWRAVYAEAGHWVRMVNLIAWTTAALLIPTSVACVGIALTHPAHRAALTIGSFAILALWIAIMQRYGWSAAKARNVLTRIESLWKLGSDVSLYTEQQSGGPGRAALEFQIAIALFVGLAWAYVYVSS